ncbi:hypothetical protein ACFVXH_20090 [Kitasatospora sp. NPDC058184]|uniref:hypothetical protein n=1 Tax=unclassified Kitasatospora TaxID=2633591 RepID=UPI000A99A413|nr:hypothetical protein [Kitasatospora sp. MY 5-36]
MRNRATKDGPGRRTAVRVTAVAGAAGVLVLGTVGYTAYGAAEAAWTGKPYPVADPAAVARHLDARTQTVYEALALRPEATPAPDHRGDDGITARIYGACSARGLSHLLESMNDTGADQPRTAALRARFTLTGVTRPEWEEAVGRARQSLTAQGWTVASSDESAPVPSLTLTPPDTGPGSLAESASLRFDPAYHTLEVSAGSECASYPDGTAVDQEGRPADLPTGTAPTRPPGR